MASKGGAPRWTDSQLADYRAKTGQAPAAAAPKPAATGPGEAFYALGRMAKGKFNKTEAAYAQLLDARKHDGSILWYQFEGIKLRLADKTFLTVDFAILLANGQLQMHDVKGAKAIFTDDARVKMKVAARLFPFEFCVVYPRRQKDGGGWDVEKI